jgi:hypothetical protein
MKEVTYSVTKTIPMSDANADCVYNTLREAIKAEFGENDVDFVYLSEETQDEFVDQYLVDFVKWVVDNHVTKN